VGRKVFTPRPPVESRLGLGIGVFLSAQGGGDLHPLV